MMLIEYLGKTSEKCEKQPWVDEIGCYLTPDDVRALLCTCKDMWNAREAMSMMVFGQVCLYISLDEEFNGPLVGSIEVCGSTKSSVGVSIADGGDGCACAIIPDLKTAIWKYTGVDSVKTNSSVVQTSMMVLLRLLNDVKTFKRIIPPGLGIGLRVHAGGLGNGFCIHTDIESPVFLDSYRIKRVSFDGGIIIFYGDVECKCNMIGEYTHIMNN